MSIDTTYRMTHQSWLGDRASKRRLSSPAEPRRQQGPQQGRLAERVGFSCPGMPREGTKPGIPALPGASGAYT